MNKTIFEIMLEDYFSEFELGDAIQVFDTYIYFEFVRYGNNIKMRVPFDYPTFKKEYCAAEIFKKDQYLTQVFMTLQLDMLKLLLDQKEENEDY